MTSIINRIKNWSEYNYMLLFLIILNIVANFTFYSGTPTFTEAWIKLIIVPLFGGILDLLIKRLVFKNSLSLPKTGIISGLFVAGIFDPTLGLHIHFIAVAIAILSKHMVKKGRINFFNPAGIGIVLTGLAFTIFFGQSIVGSWWMGATLLTIPLGLFIAYKMKKLPLTFAFLVFFPILLLILSQISGTAPFSLEQVLNINGLSGYFLFSAFMLLEPKTTPYTMKGMILFGTLVALLAALMQIYAPVLGGMATLALRENTLIALLIMNIFTGIINSKLPDE